MAPARDFALADRFNSAVANGKWQGFQTRPHIDYGDVDRYGPNAVWQQPEKHNVALPDVLFRSIEVPEAAELGVPGDGSEDAGEWWPGGAADDASLAEFSPHQTRPQQYVEIFNRGREPFEYRVESSVPWLLADTGRPLGGGADGARGGGVGAGGMHGGEPAPAGPAGVRGGGRVRGDGRGAPRPCGRGVAPHRRHRPHGGGDDPVAGDGATPDAGGGLLPGCSTGV